MEFVWFLLIMAEAYLVGSISTAILVGKMMGGDDIRTHGSGNAGATNALRTYGKAAAGLVVLGDGLKAAVAILLGMLLARFLPISEEYEALAVYSAAIGAVLGHNFPLYFHFRGGKGVLVSAVAILFADWRIGLAVVALAILIMAVTRYVSLGSMMAGILQIIFAVVFRYGDWIFIGFSVVLAGLLIFMHRGNVKRLLSGTENKLGAKREK